MDMVEWRREYIWNLQFTYQILMYGILMVGQDDHMTTVSPTVNSNTSVRAS